MGVPVPPIGSAGAWTPHGAATLHEAVDDPAASNDGDTTYASVGDGSAADFDIAPLDHPNRTDGHVVRVVSKKAVDTSQTVTLKVELFCGATLIASTTFDQGSSYGTTEMTLLDAEAEAITDYGDLSVKLTDLASPLTSEHWITSVELELPDRVLHGFACG